MTTKELITAYRQYLKDGIRPTEIHMCTREGGAYSSLAIKNSKDIKAGWVEEATLQLEPGDYVTFDHRFDPLYSV